MNFEKASIPDIDMNRVKKLTIKKIKLDKKRIKISVRGRYAKTACAILLTAMITTGSVYALSNENIKNLVAELTGVGQSNILIVGEAVSNRDYKLRVHEIVTDSYVGDVVISVEAISSESKESFASYNINLDHIGSGCGLRELEEYREPYTKYYQISFSGATFKDAYNKGKLQFSVKGMRKVIEVSLASTVSRIDMEIPAANSSNNYRFKFNKLHLSEIGLTLEGADTRNINSEYQYNIEMIYTDGTKELLRKKFNENRINYSNDSHSNEESISGIINDKDDSEYFSRNTKPISGTAITEMDGKLIDGVSEYLSGDKDDYIIVSMSFSKKIPMDKIKQVIINDVAYNIKK